MTDQSTLLRQTSQEIIDGILQEQGTMMDMVCMPFTRASLAGTDPTAPTVENMGRDMDKQAVGADPVIDDVDLGSLNWTKHQYSRKARLSQAEALDIEQYRDSMKIRLDKIVRGVHTAIDKNFAALLEDSNTFTAYAANNGSWDAGSSTPVLDIQEGKRTAMPGANCAILGLKAAQELARHPDMKEFVSNYSGGAALGMPALQAGVASLLSISPADVYIFDNFYNSANKGQTLSISYFADELCWIGYKDALRCYESPIQRVTTKEDHQNDEVAYTRVYAVAGALQKGIYLTGI